MLRELRSLSFGPAVQPRTVMSRKKHFFLCAVFAVMIACSPYQSGPIVDRDVVLADREHAESVKRVGIHEWQRQRVDTVGNESVGELITLCYAPLSIILS